MVHVQYINWSSDSNDLQFLGHSVLNYRMHSPLEFEFLSLGMFRQLSSNAGAVRYVSVCVGLSYDFTQAASTQAFDDRYLVICACSL